MYVNTCCGNKIIIIKKKKKKKGPQTSMPQNVGSIKDLTSNNIH